MQAGNPGSGIRWKSTGVGSYSQDVPGLGSVRNNQGSRFYSNEARNEEVIILFVLRRTRYSPLARLIASLIASGMPKSVGVRTTSTFTLAAAAWSQDKLRPAGEDRVE